MEIHNKAFIGMSGRRDLPNDVWYKRWFAKILKWIDGSDLTHEFMINTITLDCIEATTPTVVRGPLGVQISPLRHNMRIWELNDVHGYLHNEVVNKAYEDHMSVKYPVSQLVWALLYRFIILRPIALLISWIFPSIVEGYVCSEFVQRCYWCNEKIMNVLRSNLLCKVNHPDAVSPTQHEKIIRILNYMKDGLNEPRMFTVIYEVKEQEVLTDIYNLHPIICEQAGI